MAYHIVHRDADALRVALIVKARRYATHLPGVFLYPSVKFLRGDALLHKRSDIIKHHRISLACFADSFYLFRRLYHLMIRHFISAILKIFDPVVKRHVTGFVFSAAAAPAFIISSNFQLFIPPGCNCLCTFLCIIAPFVPIGNLCFFPRKKPRTFIRGL